MKEMLKAAAAIIGIIGVQMALSYIFSYQVAETFTKVSIAALFFYYICKAVQKRKKKTA